MSILVSDVYALKAKLNNLKTELWKENTSLEKKELADKYLSKVIDYVNELQLY